MASKPQKLTHEQMQQIWDLNSQHPKSWNRGQWYPAVWSNKAVEIRRTRSAGRPYLGIRRMIDVHLKDPSGNLINTRRQWEYFTVNLQANTMTYQGW